MTAAKTDKHARATRPGSHNGLGNSVRLAMENYFADLDGHDASNLYDLFISQVEKPMLEVVLQQSRGNITRASQMLGLNRATLRSRLKKYGLD
ncbi:MAG: DNA-binding transcriptional regulator Fis [Gammaproteobacteria bacterium]